MTFISKRVIVIGGGVAGLLASVTAASHGASVILLEKMNRVGLKMGITGKGRCNLTNAAPMMEFIKKTPGNGKFLFGAYKRFFHDELLSLLHDWGLSTKVERGGRIFPLSDDAQEVRHLFMRLLEKKGVELHLEEGATHIEIADGQVSGVRTLKSFYPTDAVILCTGGQSYPRTGSTGDGYRLAAELGHTITPIRPALVPLVCEESYCKELQGLSLKNVTLSLSAGGKRKTQEFGEMLFTHFGVSGPIVLMQSDQVSLWLSEGYEVKGEIDLKPALSEDVLDKRILRDLKTYHLKQMGNALLDLLPHSLVPVVLRLAHVSTEKPVAELTKKERISLGKVMKHLPLSIKKTRPIDEAIVTAGGVSVKEINPSTMESKLVKGLYFAGEVIDVHALTGGYNMQAAFSMGHLAAESATEGQE